MTYLSIIIPVYNTEHFLSECIESCLKLKSTFDDFEIILVDDGSTDKSLLICNNYKNLNPNIKVLSQENQKQGAARNNGLNIAKGKYIWFVDSDDMIEIESFSNIIKEFENETSDVICFNAKKISEDGVFLGKINRFSRFTKQHKFSLITNKGIYNSCPTLHFFKKSFLDQNNLKFISKISFEDNEFFIRVFDLNPSLTIFEDSFYIIRLTQNSTTRTSRYESFLDIFHTIDTILTTRKKQVDTNDILMIDILLFRNINTILFSTMNDKKIFHRACLLLRKYTDIGKDILPKHSILNMIQIKLLDKPYILRYLMILFYKLR